MPRVKERGNLSKLTLEKRYAMALKGLVDGTYKSLASAAQANNLSKSSEERPAATTGSAPRTADILPGGRGSNGEVDIEVR